MNPRLKLTLAMLLLASLACSIPFIEEGATTGSGDLVTVEGSFSGFDSLDVSHSFDVDVIQSQTYGVVVHVDDNIEQYLIMEQSGDTVILGLEDGRRYADVTLEAKISLPSLVALELSGASHAKFTQFTSNNPFDLNVSGASSAVGDIEAGDIELDISGASDVQLSGTGLDLVLEVSGASEADLEQFEVNNASLDLSGASDATVNASGTLNIHASGASSVQYVGSPTIGTIETSGASTVREK